MMTRWLLCLLGLFLSHALHAQQLTASDVQRVIEQATRRASRIAPASVIAVTDREGYVLGVWNVRGGEPGALEIASAVGKAGTAAFLSSNANAFTSRTAGFIIQQHFPPGVRNTAPGPLVGVGFSNLPFSDVNRFKRADFIASSTSPGTLGSPIPLTSLNGIPGGLPLYKNGRLVGGVGVTGSGVEFPPTVFVSGYSKDEDISLAGQAGFTPPSLILGSNVFINGISLPYVESSAGSSAVGAVTGNTAALYPIIDAPPPFPYPVATFGGVAGQVRQPIVADPLSGTINGQPRLTSAEVTAIINAAADRVRTTRAGIRLPIGSQMEVFITVVNNPNVAGVGPKVLGAFRTGDATIFSWDVAVQKGRTAIAFSDGSRAFSTRTVGFLAQSNFPPGIDPDGPGPLNGLQEELSGFVRTALPELVPTASLTTPPFLPPNPQFPNGITIFPGGFPLYRNGQLIGAIGISGDGVDQDDIAGAAGTEPFLAPNAIRADRFHFLGARLPYAKFPRDPVIGGIIPVVLPIFAPLTLPAVELASISTRVSVQAGERLMIGGFVISGTEPKRVVVRAIGPSLAAAGITSPLIDPQLELHDASGAVVAANADWRAGAAEELQARGLAPADAAEAALVETLAPGAYTATMTAQDGGTGVGLLQVMDVDPAGSSRLTSLSTRGYVGGGDEVMIGGLITQTDGTRLLVRAIGPSLDAYGLHETLADPALEIRDSNGLLLAANDNWEDAQAAEIRATGREPGDPREAAIFLTLPAGAYTAIVRGPGGTSGVSLLEVYRF